MWQIGENGDGSLSDNILKQEFTETHHLSRFEVKTVAVINSSENINNAPVHGISSPSHLAVMLEKKLTIFREDTQEICWELPFNSNCDHITFSDDLNLIFICEKPGVIHMLHLPTSRTVWSYTCEDDGILLTVQNIICSSHSSDFLSFYIMTEECIVFEFSNIETISLFKAIEEDAVSQFFKAVDVQKINLLNEFPSYTIKSIFQTFSKVTPVGLEIETHNNNLSDSSMSAYYTVEEMVDGDFTSSCVWNCEEKKFLLFDASEYGAMEKILCSRNGRYIVCLDGKHELVIFSSFSHQNLLVWGDGDVQDFTLYDRIESDSLSVPNSKIGILRKMKNLHIFEIRLFPSFEMFHKIQLSEFVHLIDSKFNQDSWYLIEGNISSNVEKSVNLKIVSVSESRPEARLMKLLNRRKFKDAERFAKMCNLNDEIIYKTKISLMLKDLSTEDNSYSPSDISALWKEVESALNKIKDMDFIKSCVLSLTPEMDITRKFLSNINHWLLSNNIDGADELMSEINRNEKKLMTYHMLPESFQSNLSLKDFLKKDLLQFIIRELIGGCLNTAILIWQKHKVELLKSLNLNEVREILNAIPDDIPSYHLITFLKEDFLPLVIINIPDVVDIISDWMISRIHLLEMVEKELWPKNAFDLASMFLQVVQTLLEESEKKAISYSTSISLSCIHKSLTSNESRTGCLSKLLEDLKLLKKLKEKFNCKISLTAFQDSKMDVIFALLDRINLNYISEAITDIARPYALENGLDLDLSLEIYIKNTLQTSHFTWWSWEDETWEEHLILVLESIHDTDRWFKAALSLVSNAKVPWSDRVKGIVEQGLNSDHSRKEEFKKQSKEVCLKEILLKYNLKNFAINKDMQLIDILVNFILKKNKDSALDDVKSVLLCYSDTLTVQKYKRILQFYLNHDKIEDLISLLDSIPPEMAIECSHSILKNITSVLDHSYSVKNNTSQVKTNIVAGLYFIKFLKSKKIPVDENLSSALRSMEKLQKEFDMNVTLSNVTSKEKALKIVEAYIHSFLDRNKVFLQNLDFKTKYSTIASEIFKVKRLSSILELDVANVLSLLISNCLKEKLYDLVVILCRELTSYYPTISAETLIQVINHFSENLRGIQNLSFEAVISTICHFSNLAVTHCEKDLIEKYMYAAQLSTYLNSVNKVAGQQLSVLSSVKTDMYHKWKFSTCYEDDGFNLNINEVSDFLMKLLPFFLRNSDYADGAVVYPLQDTFNQIFKPIITHTKKQGQTLVSLRTMNLFYYLHMNFFQSASSTTEVSSLIEMPVKECVMNLLHRMIDKRRVDLDLSIALLSIFPNEGSRILKKLQRWSTKDLRCMMSLGEIGSEFCRVFGSDEYSVYDMIYRRAVLLLKQNVRPAQSDIVLNSEDSEYNWDIVKEIILNPKTNLSTIIECCSAFDLVPDHVLTAFLNNLLSESEKLCLNKAEIPKNNLQSLLNQAECTIEAISNEALIVKNLESLLKKISSYSYEVLLFIYEQLLKASADNLTISSGQFIKCIPLLKFLSVYQRTSPVGETELEYWLALHPAETNLPGIAQKRLPFWPLLEGNIYKLINPELTANTLSVWLTVAPLLNIPKDELVMIAVKNYIINYLKKLPSKHLILNQDMCLLKKLYKMISGISDPNLAVSCASWVAKRMPPGPNKVCCCLIAVELSDKWCQSHPNVRQPFDILKKSKELHQRSAIENVLNQNNLCSDSALSFVQNPVHLVEYFIEEFCFSSESSIKVCRVAAEIAKITDINLDEIFKKYILKWMHSSSTSNNLDDTFSFDVSTEDIEAGNNEDDKNILRAINLFLGLSAIQHNIFINMKERFQSMTSIQRSRFIFCSVAAYGYTAVGEALSIPSSILEESLAVFLCNAELEHLHLYHSNADINYIDLVQSILSNQTNNPKVLLCCVRICLENEIWNSDIWDVILQRLVGMSQKEALQNILQTSQGHLAHMWNYKSFIKAWNLIISGCFKCDIDDSSKVIDKIYKTVLSCPCISALDIESLWNDLKYFIQNTTGKDLRKMEPVHDALAFLRVLKSLCKER